MPAAPGWLKSLAHPKVAIPLACIVAVLVLGVVGYLLIGDWLVAVIVALFITLGVLLVAFWRTAFAREREKRLGRGIDDREDGDIEAPVAGSPAAQMHEAVARAVDDMRSSRLGMAGSQALPWLLVIGEPGAGKSALLADSGLELPAKFAHALGRGPTPSCEWWLANQAVAIDTAGRYLQGGDEGDSDEWLSLLRLVRKQRPGLPVNGVVLAVSATTLLCSTDAELQELALAARRRLNEIEDLLHVTAPVYVVVTKCDQIEGFVETVGALSDAQRAEALGWTNTVRAFPDAAQALHDGLEPMLARLESLVPGAVAREVDPLRRRRAYAFPQELAYVTHALEEYVGTAFAASSYDEMPFLRGVYFTSAQREGSTVSPQLQRLGHAWAQHDVAGSLAAGGVFVRDLLSSELVLGDADLALPFDATSAGGRRLVHVIAGLAFAMLATWWGISFAENLSALRALSRTADVAAAGSSDISNLDELRSAIDSSLSERTVLQTGGLGGNLDIGLENAKKTFKWAFANEFETPAKTRLRASVRGSSDDAFEALAHLAQDVSWLRAGGDAEQASSPRLGGYAPVSEASREVFERSYDDFVRWSSPEERKERAKKESELVVTAARELLNIERFNVWSERTDLYDSVTYSSLGVPELEQSPKVNGAYTREGWNGIVSKLIQAVDATGSSNDRVNAFRRAYVRGYDERWRRFLRATPTPARAFSDVKGSGYVKLVETVHENMSVELPRDGEPPAWTALLSEVRRTEVSGEEEAEAPWAAYLALLEQTGTEVASASENPTLALDLARSMAAAAGSSFKTALASARGLVPNAGDAGTAAKLRSIMSMPILDGASHVLRSAIGGLDLSWQPRIVRRFDRPQLDTQGMLELYGRSGALKSFLDEDLGLFWGDQGAIPVIGDRAMLFGDDARLWLERAGNIVRTLETGARIPVVFEGFPAITTKGGFKAARRELTLTCNTPQRTYVYTEGGARPHRLTWSPDCNALELRIIALGSNNEELELKRRIVHKGPFALPDFLNEASRSGGNGLTWRHSYSEPSVSLEFEYNVQGGQTLRALQHRRPPESLGGPQ